jgi:protein involved in polysaccharide export with SLBB domain
LFEVKNSETLSDLVRFAGGFGDKAYTNTLTVLRNNRKEKEVRTVLNENYSKFNLQNGDYIKADSILNRFSNRVAISGAVFHPGNYELTPGMMLSDLIKNADGLKEDAFMNRGLISRQKKDRSPENISFDINEVLQGRNDIPLRKEDRVQINTIFEMRETRSIEISGEIQKPAIIPFLENMTLGDLIFKAGGFKEGADLSVIEVTRRLSYEQAAKVTEKMNDIFQFSISRDLQLTTTDAAFKLQPFDAVYVRRAPGYRETGTFKISGEVAYAGIYAISDKNERISDAIKRAGGVIPGAYINGATLTRTNKLSTAEIEKKKQLMQMDTTLIDTSLTMAKSYPVGIELNKILETPGSNIDLLLQPGDEINIPQELQTVKVSGQVMNPLALTFQKNLTLRNYINSAGGYGYLAIKSKTYVVYPNGNTATNRGFIFRSSPKLTPGAEIIVPRKPEKKETDSVLKWISMASTMSTVAIAIATLLKL